MVGSDTPDSSASWRWSMPDRARAARIWAAVIIRHSPRRLGVQRVIDDVLYITYHSPSLGARPDRLGLTGAGSDGPWSPRADFGGTAQTGRHRDSQYARAASRQPQGPRVERDITAPARDDAKQKSEPQQQ